MSSRFDPADRRSDDVIVAIHAAARTIATAITEGLKHMANAETQALADLANAVPGNTSPLFELHVGEGPFFQLIGFEGGGALYLVGLTRPTPLTYRQAHAVRLACRHALGEPGVRAADPSGGPA